jgi:hypothetical protein
MPRIALRSRVPTVVAAALAAVALLACVYPTDRSGEVYVSVTSSDTLLLRDSLLLQGTQANLTAQAWQRLGGGDSAAISNIEFAWFSSSPATAIVQGHAGGSARLSGVASGRTTISVVAVGYQGSKSAAYPIRVSTPFKIDSVRADTASYSPVANFNGDATHHTVKYGQLLTFYGVGIRGIFLAELSTSLGATPLLPDTFSFKGVPAGIGQMSFWVPFPAQTGKPVVLALGGNAFDTTTIKVLHRDIYKVSVPNDTLSRKLSLDAAGPIAQFPGLLFFNPALAYEELPRGDTLGADWYRFVRTDTTDAITFVVGTGQTGNLANLLLSDTVVYQSTTKSYALGDSGWTIGLGEYDCRGYPFLPVQSAPPDSFIIALKGSLPGKVIQVLSQYAVPGSYELAVVAGYATSDPSIGPDRFEGNRTCTLADANFLDPTKKIAVGGGTSFRDSSLTIDNGFEVDWFRFDVTSGLSTPVAIRSAPLPFNVADSSDIDLYLLTRDSLRLVASSAAQATTGSYDSVSVLLLAPGRYYLVVVDFAGVPTRYSLCIAAALDCTPPASAVAPGPVSPAALRARPTRRARSSRLRPRFAPLLVPSSRAPWRP